MSVSVQHQGPQTSRRCLTPAHETPERKLCQPEQMQGAGDVGMHKDACMVAALTHNECTMIRVKILCEHRQGHACDFEELLTHRAACMYLDTYRNGF